MLRALHKAVGSSNAGVCAALCKRNRNRSARAVVEGGEEDSRLAELPNVPGKQDDHQASVTQKMDLSQEYVSLLLNFRASK